LKRPSETEVAAPIVTYLQEHHWEVFQEVRFGGPGEPVADIVGRLQSPSGLTLIWVIEAKTSLNIDLLSQAVAWIRHANFVSIVTPNVRQSYRARDLIEWILSYHGIGRFTYGQYGSTHEAIPTSLHRLPKKTIQRWDKYLAVARKGTAPAGSAHGGYGTPFKETCRHLLHYVTYHPGCGLKEAIEAIPHHYSRHSTAVSSIRHWLYAHKIPGVKIEFEKGKIRLFPAAVQSIATP